MTLAVDHTSPSPTAVCLRNPLFKWITIYYRLRKDERLSWPRWLTHSGYCHLSGKWSPVQLLSTGQGKFAGQGSAFYHCAS